MSGLVEPKYVVYCVVFGELGLSVRATYMYQYVVFGMWCVVFGEVELSVRATYMCQD